MTSTVFSNNDFTADADVLHDAMRGAGTDESRLIAIIGTRTRQQLHAIDMAYRAKYGNILADKLKSETSGHFQKVLVNVVQLPEITDAVYLHSSMAGAGTNETVLNEILATRTAEELEKIKMAYISIFRSGAEKDVKGDASGKHEDLLVALLNNPRGRGETHVDVNQANADAQKLFENPTDTTFTRIFGNASEAHIAAIRQAYQTKYGRSLIDSIKKEFSGHYEDLLVTLATPRAEYFADKLYKAMKGMGTDDDTLIRVVTTRFGVDLPLIKQVFLQKYNKTLFDWVKSETSGDYRKIMLELIGGGL